MKFFTAAEINYQPVRRSKHPSHYENTASDKLAERGYIYLGFEEYKGSYSKIGYKCQEGHIVSAMYGHIMKGFGCAVCAKRAKKTSDEIINGIDGVDGYKFLRFASEKTSGNTAKVEALCPNGHTILTNYNKFVTAGYRCQECCGRKKLTTEEMISTIKAVNPENTFIRFDCDGEPKNNKVKLVLKCKHDHIFKPTYNGYTTKQTGCKACSEFGYNYQGGGYIYVQKLTGEIDAIKFGITSKTPEHRMLRQHYKSELNHELVFSHYFSSAKTASALELKIKHHFADKLRYVPKELVRDGYTETLPPDCFDEVMSIISNFIQETEK
ncbi:hypothetical protein IYQ61_000375 [Salmonella enterica]|nr:hypothetical protein [Salmonella enterica]